MSESRLSRDEVVVLLGLCGLSISEERLEEMLPHTHRLVPAWAALDEMELGDAAPAAVFHPAIE